MKNLLRSVFWRFVLRLKGSSCGKNVIFNGPVNILLRDGAKWSNIIIGNDVIFDGEIFLRLRKNGKIIVKNGVKTGNHVWLVGANDADLIINKNTILGSYNILNGGHGLEIGEYCITAGFVYINTSDHSYRKDELIQKQGFFGSPINIGKDVWLGGHVFVNKGVNIGEGAVIGAGAVVIDDISAYGIAVGNPAKVVKKRK
jgi:acetyltransferase-like isoleucine patch superfamily enzyme